MKSVSPGLLFVVLLAVARICAADDLGTTTDPVRWQPVVSPTAQLFPSLILATSTMPQQAQQRDGQIIGDANGMIGARVVAARDGQRVRLSVRIDGLARPSVIEATLPRRGRRYELLPMMLWDFRALAAVTSARPETITFELAVDGGKPEQRHQRVRVRGINEAPYFVRGGDGEVDLAWMFAAYVNEDHPLVDEILRQALATGVVRRFDGYQSGDPQAVYRQVFAIWYVLQNRGIRYSSIARTAGSGQAVLSQHVRFLDESWQNNQANCVDGSVLLASVLRKIDLDPQLVLTPGHMLLGFSLDRAGRRRAYLETTLLGADIDSAGRTDEDRSLAAFEAAVERGLATWERHATRFDRPHEAEYRIVDIAAARRIGVTPIARR
jgi:hypothetical protein